MGQAKRTTKLLLDLGKRTQGGANTGKRAYIDETAQVLNAGRRFYIEFFLAHTETFKETVVFYSKKHLEMRERPISSHELLTWAEAATVATTPTWPTGKKRKKRRAAPACPEPAIIPHCIKAHLPLIWSSSIPKTTSSN